MVFGCIIITVGVGLYTTLEPGSGASEWFPYQVLVGIGRGIIMQMPLVAVQNKMAQAGTPQLIPIVNSLVTVSQFLGGSVFVALGEMIFLNKLGPEMRKYAPGVDATLVRDAGATGFRKVIPAEELKGVIKAYDEALVSLFVSDCVSK